VVSTYSSAITAKVLLEDDMFCSVFILLLFQGRIFGPIQKLKQNLKIRKNGHIKIF